MNDPNASSWSSPLSSKEKAEPDVVSPIVVLGGGAAGLALLRELDDVGLAGAATLIEPSPDHYDQPNWMRVGTEGADKEGTRSARHLQLPSDTAWIQSRATTIDPEAHVVVTEEGPTVQYEYLVVALGVETLWDRIRGLTSSLGSNGVCSVYGYEQAERTWEMIRTFTGGRALFTAPSTPHKGGDAPFQILRRAASLWQETGVRTETDLFFTTAADKADVTGADDIRVYTGHDLVEVRPDAREAVFVHQKGRSQSQNVLSYDLLHVVPPMRPPALLEKSNLAYRDGTWKGYLEVHPESFRHKRFDSVFGIGDAVGIEGVKTGERARMQAAAVAQTLRRLIEQTA
ncbi:MAG: FAD/NAD(P)-binding oxidoreductase [Salinivenus sp.]